MKIEDYAGYELHQPTSGGKAGKGCNKTSTIQVRKNNCILVQMRYELRIFMDKTRAIDRAKSWIDGKTENASEPRIKAASFSGPAELAADLDHRRKGNGPLPVWIVFRRSSMRVTLESVAGTIRGLRMAAELLSDREE